MNRLYNIDMLKFVCAVLVVFLHVRTPYQDYILPLTRCAVPCFLIISGFLIFTKNKSKLENKLKRSIIKMLHILVWSTLLFAPVKLFRAFRDDDFSFLNLKAFADFVFFNENPFGFHLWYIGAYLYTLMIVLLLLKKNGISYAYWMIPVLLLLDLCFGKYSIMLWHKEFPFILVRNFICVGLPYFLIGMLLKHWKENILQYANLQILSLGGVVLFSLTSLIENNLLVKIDMNAIRDHYLSSTFLAISLFLLFLSTKQPNANILSVLGEKYSLYIYIFHPLFLFSISILNKFLPLFWQDAYTYLSPLVILISTIIFCRILRIINIIK